MFGFFFCWSCCLDIIFDLWHCKYQWKYLEQGSWGERVYVYIYKYVCVCVIVCACVCVFMYIYICVFTYAYDICFYICIYIYIHKWNMFKYITYVDIYVIFVYLSIYLSIYLPIYLCIYIYICVFLSIYILYIARLPCIPLLAESPYLCAGESNVLHICNSPTIQSWCLRRPKHLEAWTPSCSTGILWFIWWTPSRSYLTAWDMTSWHHMTQRLVIMIFCFTLGPLGE